MNDEDKINLDLDVRNAFKGMAKTDKESFGGFYVRYDGKNGRAVFVIDGDILALNESLCKIMETNKNVKAFMLSCLGAFLAKNKEERESFFENFEIMMSVMKEIN